MNERWVPSTRGAPIDFWIDLEPHCDTVKLIPAGELDVAAVGQLQSELDDLIEAGFVQIVIDLRRVEFIDSTGVLALLSAHERAEREHWQLAIVPGRRAVHRLFEITGAIDQVPFAPATTDSGSPASQLPHRLECI
jgi:anti-sigma B factor antagonist